MTIQQIIDDKSIKRLEKRNAIVEGILNRSFDFSAVSAACSFLPEKKIALLLEAIEEVSRSKEFSLEEDYHQSHLWIFQSMHPKLYQSNFSPLNFHHLPRGVIGCY